MAGTVLLGTLILKATVLGYETEGPGGRERRWFGLVNRGQHLALDKQNHS